MPANSAVTIPVRKASCVSTSMTTNSEAAAKGIAKFQRLGSLKGAVFIPFATLSLSVKPTRIKPVSTTIAEPTRKNARVFDRDSADAVLLCSVNFHTAQYTAKTIPGARLSVYEGIGHAPFYEDASRFNAELAAFVRDANRTN